MTENLQTHDATQVAPVNSGMPNRSDILFSGATQFSFHKEGVKLYFFEGQSQGFELILTKTQMAKIPSAKWILGYL